MKATYSLTVRSKLAICKLSLNWFCTSLIVSRHLLQIRSIAKSTSVKTQYPVYVRFEFRIILQALDVSSVHFLLSLENHLTDYVVTFDFPVRFCTFRPLSLSVGYLPTAVYWYNFGLRSFNWREKLMFLGTSIHYHNLVNLDQGWTRVTFCRPVPTRLVRCLTRSDPPEFTKSRPHPTHILN
jgi:hypothetical protein